MSVDAQVAWRGIIYLEHLSYQLHLNTALNRMLVIYLFHSHTKTH